MLRHDRVVTQVISSLRFEVGALDDEQACVAQVVPTIDGENLVDLVEACERASEFEPAGGYGGLVPSFFRFGDLRRYYLGQQEPWLGKAVAVLACDCGELGCWPLHAHISIDAQHVSWHDFAQPHRPERNYEGFGPFTFDRQAYEVEVQRMIAELAPPDAKTS